MPASRAAITIKGIRSFVNSMGIVMCEEVRWHPFVVWGTIDFERSDTVPVGTKLDEEMGRRTSQGYCVDSTRKAKRCWAYYRTARVSR